MPDALSDAVGPSATPGALTCTSLATLLPELKEAIARRAIQLGAGGGVLSLTCRAFSKTNLLHAPALRVQLDSQSCDQFLTPRVVAALQARTCKLVLTLEQQRAQSSRQYISLLTELSLQLQQLDLSSSTILKPKRPKPGAATLADLFDTSKLNQLSLSTEKMAGEIEPLLPNLQPLSQHLTQLCLQQRDGAVWSLDDFTAALQPLVQLQVLTISCIYRVWELPGLLQALPQLHTLQLPDADVYVQEQLDTLLAATQLTSIQLSLMGLSSSHADLPCSWQRWEKVFVKHMIVGAADVATLAPLCQGCTHLEFSYSSLTPSLEFWHQLVQLMPTVTHLTVSDTKGSNSAAMHQSLQLMADQPWARWLDICIVRRSDSDALPACWRASPLSQPGKLRVWFKS
ncbi:hypothetical protein V8C86DRAFT_3134353 [Haematococcus lacustris]